MNDTEIMLRAEIRVLERVIADRGYQKPPVMPSQRTPEFLAMRRKICGGSCFTEIDMLNDGGVNEASVICGPCDIKTMEQLNPKANLGRKAQNLLIILIYCVYFLSGVMYNIHVVRKDDDIRLSDLLFIIFIALFVGPIIAFSSEHGDKFDKFYKGMERKVDKLHKSMESINTVLIPKSIEAKKMASKSSSLDGIDRQKAACDVARASLDRFNRCAGGMVSKDYAEGYREACQHIIDRLSE